MMPVTTDIRHRPGLSTYHHTPGYDRADGVRRRKRPGAMALEVNGHIGRLHRYQPFDADSADLVFERQTDDKQPTFRVVTRDFLLAVVELRETRTVVLTGDAGHGKTSLCASLLEDLGATKVDAAAAVKRAGKDGREPVGHTKAGRP